MLFIKNKSVRLKTIFLVGIILTLLFLARNTPLINKIRPILLSVSSPAQYLIDWPIATVKSLGTNLKSHRKLLDENTKLREEMLILNAKLQKIAALEQENSKLRELNETRNFPKEKYSIAKTLNVNTNNFTRQIVLNKGKSDNAYIGQPVLDANGLVGQIIMAGSNNSIALLITDTKSAIPVQVNRSGTRAIAIGDGNSALELIQMPDTADIKVGDILSTSGLGSRFPAGYPVGSIKEIKRIPGEKFQKVYILPAAALDQNNNFLLVWPK